MIEWLFVPVAYLIGSISSAIIICRLMGLPPAEFLAQELRNHLRNPFGTFQGDVPHEPVTHDDVGGALVYVVTLDVAEEVQAAAAQQFGRTLHQVVALDVLDADVEQADRRRFIVLERGNQARAHDPELEEVFGSAIDVGAQVQHIGAATHGWKHAADGRAVYAGKGLEHEPGHGHQRTGVAGADAGVRLARLHQIHRHPHR